jgi:redox-sensitive bicupin YhaK (pirin superfamily)
MMVVRRSSDRGHARFSWLDSRHTFSFADYWDPKHMGFRSLRVINDDRVAPGRGFGTHPHRSMEIISYVVRGALEHRDSMGTGSVIRRGEVQLMSAGEGVLHSEMNASKDEEVRFLQIWILPDRRGGPPRYQQREFPVADRLGRVVPLVTPDGRLGSLEIQQDATLYGLMLGEGEEASVGLVAVRHAWVQVVDGEVEVLGERLGPGDGAALSDLEEITFRGLGDVEALVFDLA